MSGADYLAGKRLGILGFGKEGRAVANYLASLGMAAQIFDDGSANQFDAGEIKHFSEAGFDFVFSDWGSVGSWDLAFRSPGISILSSKVQSLLESGVEVTSQTKFFFQFCPAKIIGVTGTKGKGTTSSLIANILTNQFTEKVFLTGNIGKQDPLEILPNITADDWVVFELSSFQLQDLDRSPHIGVCLMLTSEHLDYHATRQEYWEAKSSISKFQTPADYLVYASDYEGGKYIANLGQAEQFAYGKSGSSLSAHIISESESVEVTRPVSFKADFTERLLYGEHNLENIAAALLVALLAGADAGKAVKTIKSFKGLEYRLEEVGVFGGVRFINDSFSTTPETAIAAVNSFKEPVILIAGGSEKNSDFHELAEVLSKKSNIKEVVLIGVTAERIAKELELAGFAKPIVSGFNSLEQVFSHLSSVVSPGDVVLLSPACASFGMFKNYIERGDKFKTLAKHFTFEHEEK